MRRLVKSMFLVSVWFGVLGLTYAQDIDSGVSFSQVIAALEAT